MSLQLFPARRRIPGWTGPALIAAGALLAALWGVQRWNALWNWTPWSVERRLERAEAERDRFSAEAAARAAESAGQAAQARSIEAAHGRIVELRDLTDPVLHEIRSEPDGGEPLDPARADRLRDHDRRLCEMAAAACAQAGSPASDPARPGR